MGVGNVEPSRAGQIALRHPTSQDPTVSRLAKRPAPEISSAFKKNGTQNLCDYFYLLILFYNIRVPH